MAGPARASGTPSYASDSASKFIPEIWSGKLVEKLYASTSLGEIANTDYEGEIRNKGDTVVIRTIPNITIRDYENGGTLNYERPVSEAIELQIDKAKYFAFEVNDIDKYQSDINLMDRFSNDGGSQMKIVIDRDVFGRHYSDAAAENSGAAAGVDSQSIDLGEVGAPVAITKDNVLDVIVDTATVLDEQNVPDEDRWLIVPPWFSGMLKKSDLRDAGIMGDQTSVFRNGKLGMLDRYTVYVSNNLSTVDDDANRAVNIMFGHKKALTFASQMTKMEELPNPTDFGRLVRGLNVYGSGVIDPNAIGHLYARRG